MVGITPVGPGSTPSGPLDPQSAQQLQKIGEVLKEPPSPQTDLGKLIHQLEKAERALDKLLHESNLSQKEKEELSHKLRQAKHELGNAERGLMKHPLGDWQIRHEIEVAQKDLKEVKDALGK